MILLKLPKFEDIRPYKRYGNKYMYFELRSIMEPYKFQAYVCGEFKLFERSEQGLTDMKNWINEKRKEIGEKLRLFEVEE